MLLFLSHAGADTEAARRLKQRIESAPEAQARGLKVWFDKDDLRAGETWQSQLQDAIGKATAFAVYVGSRGVVNWVEAEVNLGFSRAISGSPRIPFIPLPAREAAEEPFFGLKAVDETGSHLFFGREHETEELVKRLSANLRKCAGALGGIQKSKWEPCQQAEDGRVRGGSRRRSSTN